MKKTKIFGGIKIPQPALTLLFLCLAVTVVSLLQARTIRAMENRIGEAEERNRTALALLEQSLIEHQGDAERRIRTALADSVLDIQEAVLGNRRQVSRLEATYGNLLAAQKRRTLEGLFEEDALTAQRREAQAAFVAGHYAQASRLYGEIAAAHPEDGEARFYRYYAFFLVNPLDRDRYRPVREAFLLLEKQGYSRRELVETLAFISSETSGANSGGEEEP
jgi:hypothetical protein